MKLNLRQQRFAEEYARTGDGCASAIAAGYAPSGARQQASRMLTKHNIKAAIVELRREIRERATVDAAWVLQELAELAKTDIVDLFDESGNVRQLRDMPERARRLITGLEVKLDANGDRILKLKLTDRVRILDLIGKHKVIDAWRQPDVSLSLPKLVIRNYTGRSLPEESV